jgi:hypothetical protein
LGSLSIATYKYSLVKSYETKGWQEIFAYISSTKDGSKEGIS